MLAYLVIREGSKWTDVFRLVPGQTVTVGRAPTNQVIIKDERCSRCHADLPAQSGPDDPEPTRFQVIELPPTA